MGSNISEKYKCEWVAPERTGSRKVAEVLSYFGFTNNGKPIFSANSYIFSHLGPNEKYEDYTLICNARNPYARTYSIFKNYVPQERDKGKDSFKKFLFEKMEKDITKEMIINPVFQRTPNHIIKLENMAQDLLKLPFITDKLDESQVNMLTIHGKPLDEWEQYYDTETKEFVYNLTKHHFIAWGYEK